MAELFKVRFCFLVFEGNPFPNYKQVILKCVTVYMHCSQNSRLKNERPGVQS